MKNILSYCIPRMKYVRGILWFSRRFRSPGFDIRGPHIWKKVYLPSWYRREHHPHLGQVEAALVVFLRGAGFSPSNLCVTCNALGDPASELYWLWSQIFRRCLPCTPGLRWLSHMRYCKPQHVTSWFHATLQSPLSGHWLFLPRGEEGQ